jgi:threonylcarbamoyladenosine tRNA methylthiotransferase MtaB
MSNSYKVGLYTLGCKVSLYETEAIAERFTEVGYTVVPFDTPADVYVINTCTVTAESDAKSRKYIRRAVRSNPEAVVIVIGCYSQRSPKEVARIKGVSAVLGTQDKLSSVEIATQLLQSRSDSCLVSAPPLDGVGFEDMCVKSSQRTRGYVKIEDGCDCKCSYCAISAARGPVRSKKPADVIREVEGLAAGGCFEVVLTGIETGSYGADFEEKYTLADLLTELDKRGSCHRVRLGSMAPELLTHELVDRLSTLKIFVPHIHLSVQSASDSVLRWMKRRYNSLKLMDAVNYAKKKIPDILFTADLMVGFPGESEDDFLKTVAFVREAMLLDAHVFAYSRREGTVATDYPNQIPEQTKRERSARLIFEKNRVRDGVLSRIVSEGKPLSVIAESRDGEYFVGHSEGYVEVKVPSCENISGRLLSVKPLSYSGGTVYGEIIK